VPRLQAAGRVLDKAASAGRHSEVRGGRQLNAVPLGGMITRIPAHLLLFAASITALVTACSFEAQVDNRGSKVITEIWVDAADPRQVESGPIQVPPGETYSLTVREDSEWYTFHVATHDGDTLQGSIYFDSLFDPPPRVLVFDNRLAFEQQD
jgi:hypothetical protein